MILAESTYRPVPVRAADLALVDADLRTVVEPGSFTLRLGTSSASLPHKLSSKVV